MPLRTKKEKRAFNQGEQVIYRKYNVQIFYIAKADNYKCIEHLYVKVKKLFLPH